VLRVAFAGTFAARLEEPVRRHLGIPCEIVVADETGIIAQLAGVDVLVTMALTAEMGRAATRLKLVQVPGAVYGHETGIAEYVIGAMLALTRNFSRLDTALRAGEWQSQWSVGVVRRRSGWNWRAKRSEYLGMGVSVRRSLAGLAPST